MGETPKKLPKLQYGIFYAPGERTCFVPQVVGGGVYEARIFSACGKYFKHPQGGGVV